MICRQCANAADNRLPAEAHCTTAGCSCGHRTPTRTEGDPC